VLTVAGDPLEKLVVGVITDAKTILPSLPQAIMSELKNE